MQTQNSLSEWIKTYLKFLKYQRSASQHTVVNYGIDLRWFAKYLSERVGTSDFIKCMQDKTILQDYVGILIAQYRPATVKRRLSALKRLLRFLQGKDIIEKNLSYLLTTKSLKADAPKTLGVDEITTMLNDFPSNGFRGKRIKSIVELLYSTGMRVSELFALNENDLDFKRSLLTIRRGRSITRTIPFGRYAKSALSQYLKTKRLRFKASRDALFINGSGERLTVRSIERAVRECATHALGKKGLTVSPSVLRHSCAKHLYERGAKLSEIRELLGHHTLATTQKYGVTDQDRLRRAYETARPYHDKGESGEVIAL